MIIHKLASIQEICTRSKLKTSIEMFFKDIDTSVIQFYKAINCLNFILAQYDLFLSISKLHNRTVAMEIYLLIWNDLIVMYLMLESSVGSHYNLWSVIHSLIKNKLCKFMNSLTNTINQHLLLDYLNLLEIVLKIVIYLNRNGMFQLKRNKMNYNHIFRIQKIEKSASQVLRVCQSTDRNYRKSTSFVGQKGDNFLQNTTFGYMKKISTATNPIAFQYTFESESKTEIQQK